MEALAPALPPRACDLCDHGIDVGGVRHCVCLEVVLPNQLPRGVPVQFLRSVRGACGPEAVFMQAPFLQAA